MSWSGKVVWVTGASSGIGAALARAFAAEGAALILSGRRREALDAVAADVPDSLVLPFEATDYATLPGIVAQAEGWRGRVDVLVNNAGVSQRSLARDTGFEVYRRLMEVDFFGPLRLTQLLLPAMRARGDGHFIGISSLSGKFGTPVRTGYCAAKHALMGYFDALRAETAHEGIRVTMATPGFVQTGVSTNALTGDGSPRGRSDSNIAAGISPEAAAATILAGIAAGKREIPVGEGPAMKLLDLMRSDPDKLFDVMAAEGRRIAASSDAA